MLGGKACMRSRIQPKCSMILTLPSTFATFSRREPASGRFPRMLGVFPKQAFWTILSEVIFHKHQWSNQVAEWKARDLLIREPIVYIRKIQDLAALLGLSKDGMQLVDFLIQVWVQTLNALT